MGGKEVKQMLCGCWDERVVPLRDKHVVCVRWGPFVGWALFVLLSTGKTVTGKPAASLTASRPHIEPLASKRPSRFRCSLAGPRWAKLHRGSCAFSHGAELGQRHGKAAPHSLPLVLTCKLEFGTILSLVRFHLLSCYSAAAGRRRASGPNAKEHFLWRK